MIEFEPVEVPRDPEDPDFCVSFTNDQVEQYKEVCQIYMIQFNKFQVL
jgi:hypothetical protein